MTTAPNEAEHQGGKSAAALWVTVENHGSMIRSLAEETASQFRDFRGEVAAQITGLSNSTAQQIGGITATIEKLANKFDASAQKSADAQKPQWLGIIAAAVGAVGLSVTIMQTLSGLHDKPTDDKIVSLTASNAELARTTALSISDLAKSTASAFTEAAKNSVSIAEFKLVQDYQAKIGDIRTAMRDQAKATMQAEVDRLAMDQVPRREHQYHWDAEEKTDAHLETEITAINRRLDDLAPASDTLKHLEAGQHELELKVYGVK